MLMTLADTIRNVGFLVVILWHREASFGPFARAHLHRNQSLDTRLTKAVHVGPQPRSVSAPSLGPGFSEQPGRLGRWAMDYVYSLERSCSVTALMLLHAFHHGGRPLRTSQGVDLWGLPL